MHRLHLAAVVLTLVIFALGGISFWQSRGAGGLFAALHDPGPIQSGHAMLDCQACHVDAPGTTRQQVQAWLKASLAGTTGPDFGRKDVDDAICESCHSRTTDRHPRFRFNEPRFAKALTVVAANTCLGCHSEHQAARVSLDETTFCRACHDSLVMKNDPLDVPHVDLVKQANWQSCLGCHDFHGNHVRTTPERLANALPTAAILAYFGQGPSPYGDIKKSPGKDAE